MKETYDLCFQRFKQVSNFIDTSGMQQPCAASCVVGDLYIKATFYGSNSVVL